MNKVMELYQLRSFVAVAKEGNLTRAAQRIHTSQPSVSSHIKALEHELGVTLFRRTSKGMVLTRVGADLLKKANSALDAVKDLVYQARSYNEKLEGDLRVGLNTDPGFLRVTDLYSQMEENHPNINLRLISSHSGQIQESLLNGDMDAGFQFGTNVPDEFAHEQICSLKMCIVGPIHWKERMGEADLKELTSLTWIMPTQDCPCYQLGTKMFERRKLTPEKIMEVDSEEVVHALVAAGKGIALMREDEALAAEAAGEIFIWTGETIPLKASFIFMASRANDPLMRALYQAVLRVWGLADPVNARSSCPAA